MVIRSIWRQCRDNCDNRNDNDNSSYSVAGGYKHTAEPWHRPQTPSCPRPPNPHERQRLRSPLTCVPGSRIPPNSLPVAFLRLWVRSPSLSFHNTHPIGPSGDCVTYRICSAVRAERGVAAFRLNFVERPCFPTKPGDQVVNAATSSSKKPT
jgi:hypothetical protein